ncbi:MAG: hypothetical protein OEW30_18145, partial [Acidimicrobiia bacterium]|nr:hypothetical protein [Acidimicrobiia bacterium]
MSENGLLGQIAGALAETLASLGSISADPSIATAMFARLGYDVTIDDDAMASLGALLPSGDDIDILRAVAADVRDGYGIELESIVGVMEVAARVVESLNGLAPGASVIANLPPPLNDESTWTAQGIGGAIADDLLRAWLTTRLPFLSAALQVLGVIEEWVDPVSGATRVHVNWPQLTALVNNPRSALDAAYGWSGEFASSKALGAAISAGRLMGLEADFGDVTQAEYDVHFAPAPVPPSIQAAHLFFFKGFVPDTEAYGEVGLSLTPIPESPGLDVSGLSLANRSSVAGGVDASLGGDWRLEFAAGADASSAYYIEWWPGARPGIHGAAPTFDVELALVGEPTAPWRIGAQDGPRLELGGVRLSAKMAGTAADPEFVLGLDTLGDGLVLFVPVGSGDSFIKEMVPQAIEAGIALDVEWSSQRGVTFGGGTSFRSVIPLNKDLGPLHVQYVEVELQPGTRTALIFGVAAGVTIGPVDIVINGVGLQVELDVTGGPDATFGPFEAGLAFKPPHGIGVAIDIEDVIRGGGYLELHPDRGEYSGVFDVDVLGLGVTAIGLLTTPLPGQEDGWSLFFSISARFPIPIQIGFGLTLNALGALFGLHRRMDTAAVAAGISDG